MSRVLILMDSRQKDIFTQVVESYIKNAAPISSHYLCDSCRFQWSPATVRAELLDLEEEGFLTHPHTSAGRIPTEKGYRFYVEHLMQPAALGRRECASLEEAYEGGGGIEQLKALARLLSELSENAVMVAEGANNVYYTGVRNLFSQPEFMEHTLVSRISDVLDALEKYVPELLALSEDEVQILIGGAHPLGRSLSVVTMRLPGRERILGLFGPIRMDYARIRALIDEIHALVA